MDPKGQNPSTLIYKKKKNPKNSQNHMKYFRVTHHLNALEPRPDEKTEGSLFITNTSPFGRI